MFSNSDPIVNQPVDQDEKGIFSSSKTFSGLLFITSSYVDFFKRPHT